MITYNIEILYIIYYRLYIIYYIVYIIYYILYIIYHILLYYIIYYILLYILYITYFILYIIYYIYIPSGKRLHSYGKSQSWIGQSTLNVPCLGFHTSTKSGRPTRVANCDISPEKKELPDIFLAHMLTIYQRNNTYHIYIYTCKRSEKICQWKKHTGWIWWLTFSPTTPCPTLESIILFYILIQYCVYLVCIWCNYGILSG